MYALCCACNKHAQANAVLASPRETYHAVEKHCKHMLPSALTDDKAYCNTQLRLAKHLVLVDTLVGIAEYLVC